MVPRLLSLLVAVGVLAGLLVTATLKPSGETSAQVLVPQGTSAGDHAPESAVGIPVRLRIPRLQVDADIETMGLTIDGKMAVPAKAAHAGWFSWGARPGEQGNAVIAGHLDTTWSTGGVFEKLHRLQNHDLVYVDDSLGQTFAFEVTGTAIFGKDNAPLEEIFGASPSARLNLITCNGLWIQEKRNYDKRLVIFTEALGQN